MLCIHCENTINTTATDCAVLREFRSPTFAVECFGR